MSRKYGNNKTDVLSTRNGPVQRVEVEESTRHKWVNFCALRSGEAKRSSSSPSKAWGLYSSRPLIYCPFDITLKDVFFFFFFLLGVLF